MKEELITFETAKLAKEVGFDWRVRGAFGDELDLREVCAPIDYNTEAVFVDRGYVSAPTQSLLQRWLRDEKNICIEIEVYMCGSGFEYMFKVHDFNSFKEIDGDDLEESYEQALEAGLFKAMTILKEKV